VCSGQNIVLGQITAAQCLEAATPGAQCVSCGTGQSVIDPLTFGNKRSTEATRAC